MSLFFAILNLPVSALECKGVCVWCKGVCVCVCVPVLVDPMPDTERCNLASGLEVAAKPGLASPATMCPQEKEAGEERVESV
jgi:hypothetical protein